MVENNESEREWEDIVTASNLEKLADISLSPLARVITA
jgi:hypothetical protein